MTELRTDQPAAHRAARARRPRRTAWMAAGVGLLAAASATASVIVLTGPSGSTGGHVTAVTLLRDAADAAARAPMPKVTDNQYMYIETEIAAGSPYGKPAPSKPYRTQVWSPAADKCKDGLRVTNGKRLRILGNSSDLAANGIHLDCPLLGWLNDPTYRLLQTLPTDPHALLDMIYKQTAGKGNSPDQEAFTTIGDLLRDSIAPPEVSAALFRAAALIPGVTLVPNAVDAIGRAGVAVSFTYGPDQLEWIFNKQTLQMLGEVDVYKGTLTETTAIISRAIVDHLGQVPKTG